MSPSIRCEEAEQNLPELAIGSLAGEERALVVSHLADCAPCRRLSEDIIRVVEELAVLTPPAEPSAGFESRALAAMTGERPAHRRRRARRSGARRHATDPTPARFARSGRWLAGVALIVAFLAGSTAGVSLGRRSHPTSSAAGAAAQRSAALVGARGTTWGTAVVHAGADGWVFVSMRWDLPDGVYNVQLTGPGIPTVQLDGLDLVNGEASLGRSVGGDLSRVQTVRILDSSGVEICRATFS